MKLGILLLIGLILFIFSCNHNQEKTNSNSFAPKVVEAHGYIVPKDSMAEPKVIPAGKPRIIRAGNPKVVFTNTNVHHAGIPKVVKAGVPRECIPGKDGFSLPKIVPAIDSPFLAGIPEVVIAKEASSKDQNPQNLSFFGKLQGLNHGIILCLTMDKSGNLWFGSLGGGVSKYDGKSFTHFTEKQGLINNYVRCVLEDKNGNLWFGTSGGVSKYDGKRFTNYTEKEGLSNRFILSILQDKRGNLWFGTQGGGVNQYDGKRFTHFTVKEGLSNNVVNSILEDKNNNLWFGTYRGVNKYTPDYIGVSSGGFTHFTVTEGLSNNEVISMLEDKSGNLWFGTNGGGVIKYSSDSIGSISTRGKSQSQGAFTHFTSKEGLSNNFVYSMAEDKNGNFWFGTFGGGVNKFDYADGGKNLPAGPAGFTHFTIQEGLSNNNIRAILEDKSGNLWFGTNGGGLNKFDGSNNINTGKSLPTDSYRDGQAGFSHFTDKEGLSNNNVRSILEDKSGNLWFGTYGGGVCKYDLAEDGKLLTDGATATLSKARFSIFTDKEGLNNNIVSCMLKDKSGNLWFVTLRGLSKYDGKSFTQFTDKEGLISNDIRSILEDKSGNLWFGSGNNGVCKFDGKSFTYFTIKEGLSNNHVRSILEDKNGNLWFGTAGGGVCKFDGKNFTHFTIKQGLSHNDVSSILEDKSGNLWFGTYGGGVSKLDFAVDGKSMNDGLTAPASRSRTEGRKAWFTYFTEREGLSNDVVTSILEDKRGDIWIGTLRGLNKLHIGMPFAFNNKLDTATKNKPAFGQSESNTFIKTYTYEDGFSGIGVNHGKTIYEAKDGTIWIGADDRLTAFHPGEETPDTIAPNIQLSGLALFNENIGWQNLKEEKDTNTIPIVLGNGIKVHDFHFDNTSRWYGIPENLSLAYDNNYLTFQFVGITLQNPKKVKYQYQLEGHDQNWSILTSRSEAIYGNLPYGKYTFKVKAMNGGGYWSNELDYSFKIQPPWWFTWWAYSIYGLLTGCTVWFLYRYQRQRIIRNERAKTQERELQQAKEIEKAYTTLKSTQAQLIQSEKMASLGELTAGIAHEIQNPLNFVNNFSSINAELIDEMKTEMDNGNTDEVKALVNDILDNEQKIILHGKRAENIVKGMLEHSRKSTGVKELTDINALANEYFRMAYHSFQSKQKDAPEIKLVTEFEENLPFINVIPNDIGRVLLNLFNNAFWAAGEQLKTEGVLPHGIPSGKTPPILEIYNPTVSLITKKIENIIEIHIVDNGIGIPQKIKDKIFQPFFTTKPTGQGTGLGLSLSYDIIKAHGGEIKLVPGVQEGTEFIIQLPIN